MGVNVKGFMLQPVGPEALGWFKEPIASMDDFRKYRFRTPPGIPGQTYKDIGVASVAMGGGDILPALEKGTIDAAEWCCPKPDSVFGFQKVLKHYYLQGLHQVVVNADLYINGDVYDGLTDLEKKALEVAANASLSKAMSYRIYENGKALKDLTENHGVILHDIQNSGASGFARKVFTYGAHSFPAISGAVRGGADGASFDRSLWLHEGHRGRGVRGSVSPRARLEQIHVKCSAHFRVRVATEDGSDSTERQLRRLIETFGRERIVWGSDYPFVTMEDGGYAGAVGLLESQLAADPELIDMIRGENFMRLFPGAVEA
ncbi:Amidohydrolase 2 [Ostreococcus tauri]|uniref:Amidohydrolase 2 n=1 Tax=Ostreococcus tauri TaxID=70448 RepID=A0A090LZ42_OSTTA|nr:Amidohydrolase 2 [Ostreococcus tauri]CEF97270.1 Amidohydrolase 2 [Ostreococcus tauri]|eukprot:XP_022838587.1 Amidohydrolase 2 [Ostreococcus tauri]